MRALHPLPEGRYEGALEMGDALAATACAASRPSRPTRRVALDPTVGDADARRADGRHARAPTPPGPAHPPAAGADRRAAAAARPPARRPARGRRRGSAAQRAPQAPQPAARGWSRSSCCSRVVVVGVLGLPASLQDSSNQAVQLRENIRGDVQDAVDQIKGLIDDNTR